MTKARKGNYIVSTLNGMAQGFFCSLIIGTILKQIGGYTNIAEFVTWGTIAGYLMGPAIGVGVGFAVNATGLNLVSAIIAGAIGAGTFSNGVTSGNPISAYIAVVLAIEVTRFVQGKTPVDMLLVPFVSIIVAGIVTIIVGPYVTSFISWIGSIINDSVTMQPFVMSILVSVIMGMALTAPISSAAIAVMLNLSGLAAGAALVGCCCQMVGFAMQSIHDNDFGDVLAVFFGTSMLHFQNIVKKPIIWLPTIISSMILAPIAVVVFNIQCNAIGAGMGTAGFVGVLSAVDVMGQSSWLIILLFTVILPMALTLSIHKAFVKLGYIRSGDLKITRL